VGDWCLPLRSADGQPVRRRFTKRLATYELAIALYGALCCTTFWSLFQLNKFLKFKPRDHDVAFTDNDILNLVIVVIPIETKVAKTLLLFEASDNGPAYVF